MAVLLDKFTQVVKDDEVEIERIKSESSWAATDYHCLDPLFRFCSPHVLVFSYFTVGNA